MKNIYEVQNDLIEAAEKLNFQWSKINENRIVVFGPLGSTLYQRGANGGWEKTTEKTYNE